ncbi:MAG: hypothetical protein ACRD0K_24770 [Egibacteraceae bacterium]
MTGAEGAVGRAVVRRLVRGGGEVRVFLDLERAAVADPAPLQALSA